MAGTAEADLAIVGERLMMSPTIQLSGGCGGEARNGKRSFNQVFPFCSIEVLCKTKKVERVNVRGCEGVVEPS
jgi:hypothetical protein